MIYRTAFFTPDPLFFTLHKLPNPKSLAIALVGVQG
jgi:hypothetical protein